MTLRKIISGGQTGVDRAALDVALTLGVSCGGWCPKGRLAEDGPISDHYPLQETSSSKYPVRTEKNVQCSDATLILNIGSLSGGTALTAEFAKKNGRPCKVINLDKRINIEEVVAWLHQHNIAVLNIAGPRASKRRDLYEIAHIFLVKLISLVTK
jgi:predicted Rossmann fold nucleotide-binding protein DprA/Smf involved in DNA uptake